MKQIYYTHNQDYAYSVNYPLPVNIKRNRIIISIITVFFLMVCGITFHASGQVSQKNTKETLTQAGLAYHDLKFSLAALLFEQSKASLSQEDLRKLADCYWQVRNYPKCFNVYQQLVHSGMSKSDLTSQEQFRIGELFARNGQYEKASHWLESIREYTAKATAYGKGQFTKTDVDAIWQVNYLNINTAYREFSPMLSDNTLLFSSNRPVKTKQQAFRWDGDFYSRLWQVPVSRLSVVANPVYKNASVSKTKDKKVKAIAKTFDANDTKISSKTQSKYLPKEYIYSYDSLPGNIVNGFDQTKYNAGGIALDEDKNIYFSANYPKANKQGDNRLRLMQGHYTGNTVEQIQALPFGENTYSVMHPAITPDGRVIVFSSDKGTGPGKFDLYYSTRENKNDSWKEPLVITGQVNTSGNEVFPSITPDGYLYFSSDGKEGLGGLDIYRIKLDNALAGTGVPEHLSSPVNSTGDDFGWTQTRDGETAYFTSDRNSSEDNIYSARYDTAATRLAMLAKMPRSVEGFVLDRQTMEPFKGATVFLWNKCDNKVYVTRTDDKGKYAYPVSQSCEVVILGTGKGYSKDCLTIQTVFDKTSPETVQKAPHDLLLDKYTQNLKWKLSDIHYNFDKWDIRADARPILDSLVAILKAYPIKVELGSHTDSRGTFDYNDRLSQRRAESAVAYIVSKGIDPSRITAKGYGEHQLLNKCANGVPCSEAEHQANRRTEIKVTIGPDAQMPKDFDPESFDIRQSLTPDQLPKGLFDNCK